MPLIPKILAGIIIAYNFSAIDLIPDFIPVLGYLDNAPLLLTLVPLTLRFILRNVFACFKSRLVQRRHLGGLQRRVAM